MRGLRSFILGSAAVLSAGLILGPSIAQAGTCTIAPQNPSVATGGTVNWTASLSGIKGTPIYDWTFRTSSTTEIKATTATRSVTYNTAGTWSTNLVVKGKSNTSANCSTTVRVGDTTPPTVSLAASPAGPTYTTAQTVTLTATANDTGGSGMARVEFYDGGTLKSTDTTSPYTYPWAITSANNGSHSWTAKAYDAANNVGTSTPLVLTVNIPVAPVAPTCNITAPTENTVTVGKGGTVNWSAVVGDANGNLSTIQWTFGGGIPASASTPVPAGNPTSVNSGPFTVTYNNPGTFTTTLNATDTTSLSCTQTKTVQVTQTPPNVSINSSSQSCGLAGQPACANQAVPQQPAPGTLGGAGTYRLFANNDLGMHCGDLDTRIASILPPFNVLHAQVVKAGGTGNVDPALNPSEITSVTYSAASNPNDPGLATGVTPVPSNPNAHYKTNFWDVAIQAFDPFYPAAPSNPFLAPYSLTMNPDEGLPFPDVEALYILGTGLDFTQQNMPGIAAPYSANDPQGFALLVGTQPFFTTFAFGYTASVGWYEAAGVPISTFDDFGRENSYPVMRVQARTGTGSGTVVATTDTVVPVSAEADCQTCHGAEVDGGNGTGIEALTNVQASNFDPQEGDVPLEASAEWASDQNILKLHDLREGTHLITGTTADFPTPGTAPFKSVVCQTCHYTPALDLAQVGPNNVNGRQQTNNQSMSRVMHNHHGQLRDSSNNLLFPLMEAPTQDVSGNITNQTARNTVLDQTCYRCHPGDRTKCLRGAMFTGGMLCQDCHGDMTQVGNDFSRNMPGGSFILANNFYTDTTTPRVPWANEPGCGSCHTGDAKDNGRTGINTTGTFTVNVKDKYGNNDNLRLLQAFTSGTGGSYCDPTDANKVADPTTCPKVTPIVPSNKRFAEDTIVDGAAPTVVPGGNPKLYRVSTGHSGVYCEACHGSTHAEWPNANPNANDNLMATQLQGHSGTIVECSVCHTNEWDNAATLLGPHGLHPVGANVPFSNRSVHGSSAIWGSGGYNDATYQSKCQACHGGTSRSSSTGTVLSRAFAQRTLRGQTVPQGTPIACTRCH
jgi:hypothetical protein